MATKKYDAVAKIVEDRNGTEKVRWHNIGPVFESDKGLSLKVESLPVGPGWNGWISFFEPKEQEKPKGKPAPVYKGGDDDSDSIPF